jgi:dihydroorotate dehydrogenase (NAD+) catalytic subunit
MEPKEQNVVPDVGVNLGPIHLKNPIITASGTYGFGREYGALYDLGCLGAIITKTITLEPREGNPPPRLVESAAGLINSIGLANPGLHVFLEEHLPFLASFQAPLIASVAGSSLDEYERIVSRLAREDTIAALEINVSCPNVDSNGDMISARPDLVQTLAARLRRITDQPLIFKLSPQIGTVVASAEAAKSGGAHVLSLVNTFPALAIDADRRCPVLGNAVGGLSGPAIKPIALRVVWDVARRVDLPIIGSGGICSVRDVVEFALAGASAVSVGTANFVNPLACSQLAPGLKDYLQARGIGSFSSIVGTLQAV